MKSSDEKNLSELIKFLMALDQHAYKYKASNEPLFKQINAGVSNVVKEVVNQYGYPEKNREFDLLVQHSNSLEFVRTCFKKYKKSMTEDIIPYMIDSIAVREGRKQIYGTIVETRKTKEGNFTTSPLPIKNAENVDSERAKYGLEPLEDYLKRAREMFVSKTQLS